MGGGRASSIHVFITARVFYLRASRERKRKGILFFKNNALLHRSSPAILFRLSFTLPAARLFDARYAIGSLSVAHILCIA